MLGGARSSCGPHPIMDATPIATANNCGAQDQRRIDETELPVGGGDFGVSQRRSERVTRWSGEPDSIGATEFRTANGR